MLCFDLLDLYEGRPAPVNIRERVAKTAVQYVQICHEVCRLGVVVEVLCLHCAEPVLQTGHAERVAAGEGVGRPHLKSANFARHRLFEFFEHLHIAFSQLPNVRCTAEGQPGH